MKKKRKKKLEFSKKIFIGVTIGAIMITIFTCIMSWKTQDISILSYLITGIFAEFATATGFYYNKAKAENEIKITKAYQKIEKDTEYDSKYYDRGDGV